MATITEDYVSFEIAKLLKEKGFDIACEHHYINCSSGHPFLTDIRDEVGNYYKNSEIGNDEYSAPTLQMTMKWLREIYKFEVRSKYDYDKDSWWGSINPMFEETDENSDIYQKALIFDYQGKSYEQACEAAIEYCLKHLIK